MSTDKKPEPSKDTSKSGREEEVVSNKDNIDPKHNKNPEALPDKGKNSTEGERRFKEGMANNSDTNS